MTLFDYRLNPLYPIKECSSCGALYTTDYCCSVWILGDNIICDLDKTLDLSQRSLQNCPKCRNPVYGHYCQGCALLRKKFKEDLFASCVENRILQDSSGPSIDNSNVANALREPFVVNLDPGNNSSQSPPQISPNHPDPEPFNNQTIKELPPTVQSSDPKSDLVHNYPNFPVIHQPPQEMNIQEMEDLKQQYFDEMKCLFNSEYRDEIKIDELKGNFNITPSLSTKEPDNSLSMGDEHLDTISAMESNEFIKCSVENLIPIPSESEGVPDNMCDVPFHDNSSPLDFSKDQFEDFSDSNDEFSLTDDDSFSIDNIDYVEASPPYSELVSSEVMEIVIPEVGGIDDDILLTIKDDILREILLNINLLIAKIEALNEDPTPSSDFMTKSSSTSLNSLLEETNSFDNSLPEFETFCFDVKEISSGSTTTRSDISLPEYEAFYDNHVKEISSGSTTTRSDISLPEYEAFYDNHVKEISSGSTTTHSDSSLYDAVIFDRLINPFPPVDRSDFYEFADELIHIISPPEYDCFFFKIEPNSGNFTMDVVEDISPTREPRVHNALPTHPTLQLNMEFKLSSGSLFTYVVLETKGPLVPIVVSVRYQKPGHLAARLGCAESKVVTWDDLAFKLILAGGT
uniref:Uncharacterized protein n=1 Tax=Tanacetum cinerariifolium TaxID=118510 RepID=A0A6L2KRS4_TANCI|nr:hypothetical protein [Tanacetum cinerariifolium]